MSLIDRIGRELQARFRFDEIDSFLAEFGISPPQNVRENSKWVYSKAALRGAPNATILKIADELSLESQTDGSTRRVPPANWRDTTKFRLFISHISRDKLKATRLRECLDPYAISGFVAHEDISPTLEWQAEVERALQTMDAFLAIHTVGFSQSNWTQQEIGFALGRGVKIISLGMGEDPTGFISKNQALPRRSRTAEAVAAEVNSLLAADALTSTKLLDARAANNLAESSDQIPF